MTTTAAPVTTYEDALEDVHTRFVLNLPDSELQTADRIFFQLEQAWWFYEDFICDPHPEWDLPRYATFKPFAIALFEYSPLLNSKKFHPMWSEFSQYKRKISNYGCILLNTDCTKVVLCRVWNGKSYTFPAGKINQGEDGIKAAARETYEETGFDPSCSFGLTATWKQTNADKVTWKPMREKDALVYTEDSGKRRTAYVVAGVPEDFPFEPVARKEVSLVTWYSLDDIPRPSFGVVPFLGSLRRWIKKYKKASNRSGSKGRDRSNRRSTPGRNKGSRSNTPRKSSRSRVIQAGDDLVAAGLATEGDVSGWSEEQMFLANEKLLGRRVEYDGNPHVFAEQGFAGKDPHAFRVVGGTFLNSGIQSLAPPPDRSKLQPLFRSAENEDDTNAQETSDGLTPFFSNAGETPWGEVVEEACDGQPQTTKKTKQQHKKSEGGKAGEAHLQSIQRQTPMDELFLTDAQITARSQAIKATKSSREEDLRLQYEQDMEYLRRWVEGLPKPRPTKFFGDFKLDVDRIMAAADPALSLPSKR